MPHKEVVAAPVAKVADTPVPVSVAPVSTGAAPVVVEKVLDITRT